MTVLDSPRSVKMPRSCRITDFLYSTFVLECLLVGVRTVCINSNSMIISFLS